MNTIYLAFCMTLFAGLSTGIGSAIAFFAKKTNKNFLAVSLGFSAGVMIYVSLVEIFVKGHRALSAVYGEKLGLLWNLGGFFGGIFVMMMIDRVLPKDPSPQQLEEQYQQLQNPQVEKTSSNLMRTGLFTALAIAIHNVPEGLATFVSALHSVEVAIPIVVAIALHNIPEGIAVSVPIYYATGDKKKAFLYSFASGLAEPVGALVGYAILMPFMSDTVYGLLFAMVAGIMVYISVDELLPSAQEYGEQSLSIYGLVGGMAMMGISLWMFM